MQGTNLVAQKPFVAPGGRRRPV